MSLRKLLFTIVAGIDVRLGSRCYLAWRVQLGRRRIQRIYFLAKYSELIVGVAFDCSPLALKFGVLQSLCRCELELPPRRCTVFCLSHITSDAPLKDRKIVATNAHKPLPAGKPAYGGNGLCMAAKQFTLFHHFQFFPFTPSEAEANVTTHLHTCDARHSVRLIDSAVVDDANIHRHVRI